MEERDYPTTIASSYLATYYARKSTIDSGYAEATVPVVKSAWLPGVHTMDIQLSGRSERYDVNTGTPSETYYFSRTPPMRVYTSPTLNGQPYFSNTSYRSSNYTVGVKYQPVTELTLRASWATAFLPPTPAQLLANRETTTTTLGLDPVTGAVNRAIDVLNGGNSNLAPQNSKSFNMGVIWVPTWKTLHGLRMNAEYYKIEQFNAIDTLGVQAIVNQESAYPDRVTRDSSGRITLVDNSMVNLYHRETEGLDLSANYELRTGIGTFNVNAVGSIVLHLRNQYSQSQPECDAVNFPSEVGAEKYKANATFSWEWRGWTAGWTTRYFSSYRQYGAVGGPEATQRAVAGSAPSTNFTLPQGSDSIPSQTYHDLLVGYAFGQRSFEGGSKLKAGVNKLLDGLTVQFGMRNVFEKVPPLDVFYSSNYYLSPYGDMRLSSYWVSVRKSF